MSECVYRQGRLPLDPRPHTHQSPTTKPTPKQRTGGIAQGDGDSREPEPGEILPEAEVGRDGVHRRRRVHHWVLGPHFCSLVLVKTIDRVRGVVMRPLLLLLPLLSSWCSCCLSVSPSDQVDRCIEEGVSVGVWVGPSRASDSFLPPSHTNKQPTPPNRSMIDRLRHAPDWVDGIDCGIHNTRHTTEACIALRARSRHHHACPFPHSRPVQ